MARFPTPSFYQFRLFLPFVAVVFWVGCNLLILFSGGAHGTKPVTIPDQLETLGSLVLIFSSLGLVWGFRHGVVMVVMTAWLAAAILSIITLHLFGHDPVHTSSALGAFLASSVSLYMTRSDYRVQKERGRDAPRNASFFRRYPQALGMAVAVLSSIAFFAHSVHEGNVYYIAACLSNAAGDAAFAFSRQAIKLKKPKLKSVSA